MNKNINQSFNYLISEYKRLRIKEKNKTIKKNEKETLRKLISFIGKDEK